MQYGPSERKRMLHVLYDMQERVKRWRGDDENSDPDSECTGIELRISSKS